ncbi:MAG: hypothetical protein ACR2PV_01320 [Gammaproteobacteria bacterium]
MQRNPLKEQLAVLVNNFGYEKVHKLVGEIGKSRLSLAPTGTLAKSVQAKKAGAKPKSKPNAVRFVETLNILDNEKRNLLRDLAARYENKQFMPNVAHVRGFLGQENRDVSRIKSRQQVTLAVFKILAQYDVSDLSQMIEFGAYGPPKRLGSYAKAIENFGQSRRQSAQ